MKRALVLGGGGPIGVGWETGVVHGLVEAGFALDSVDAIVGTSAGAIVGAQIGRGQLPPGPSPEGATGGDASDARGGKRRSGVDFSKLDAQALGQIYTIWTQIMHTTPELAASIGKIVRGLDRSAADAWVAEMAATIAVTEWPERPLFVCVVDTESGERRVFERKDGVPIGHAVAASSAVPGLLAAVEIQGRIYMDGQVQSSTNADVLLPHRPAQVLIAMPTNIATGRGLGPHAERMLEREIAALEAAGSEVLLLTPSSEDTQRMGTNLMDYSKIRDAYAVGLDAGRAWAAKIA